VTNKKEFYGKINNKLSHRHVIEIANSNLISVIGGLYNYDKLLGIQTVDVVAKLFQSKFNYFIINLKIRIWIQVSRNCLNSEVEG